MYECWKDATTELSASCGASVAVGCRKTKENTRKHSSPWTGACWGCKCHSYHAENLRAPQARSSCEWSHSLSATLGRIQLSTPGASLVGHLMGWEAESVPGLSCMLTASQLKATFRATRDDLNATGMPNEPTIGPALILRSCIMTCFPFIFHRPIQMLQYYRS